LQKTPFKTFRANLRPEFDSNQQSLNEKHKRARPAATGGNGSENARGDMLHRKFNTIRLFQARISTVFVCFRRKNGCTWKTIVI
jgi:hypothetical protein